jgi:hypothetical protein
MGRKPGFKWADAGRGLNPENVAFAVCRCGQWIDEYEKYGRTRKRIYMFLQTVAVLATASTPFLVQAKVSPTWVQAVPSAAAAVIIAALAIYRWQENIARSYLAAEQLKGEIIRYKAHQTDEKGLIDFVEQMLKVRIGEVTGWQVSFQKSGANSNTNRNG